MTTTATMTEAPALQSTTRLTRLTHRGYWRWLAAAAAVAWLAVLLAFTVTTHVRHKAPACEGRQYVAGGVCWTGSAR